MLLKNFFPFILLFIFCSPARINFAEEEQKILWLLQQERKAHFEKNVDLFVAEFADSMVSVNKGKVIKL